MYDKKHMGKAKDSKSGVTASMTRNPNKHVDLNDAPDGPYSHSLGQTGDSGVHGGAETKHRGATYFFK